jgi:hypothetical protein
MRQIDDCVVADAPTPARCADHRGQRAPGRRRSPRSASMPWRCAECIIRGRSSSAQPILPAASCTVSASTTPPDLGDFVRRTSSRGSRSLRWVSRAPTLMSKPMGSASFLAQPYYAKPGSKDCWRLALGHGEWRSALRGSDIQRRSGEGRRFRGGSTRNLWALAGPLEEHCCERTSGRDCC